MTPAPSASLGLDRLVLPVQRQRLAQLDRPDIRNAVCRIRDHRQRPDRDATPHVHTQEPAHHIGRGLAPSDKVKGFGKRFKARQVLNQCAKAKDKDRKKGKDLLKMDSAARVGVSCIIFEFVYYSSLVCLLTVRSARSLTSFLDRNADFHDRNADYEHL